MIEIIYGELWTIMSGEILAADGTVIQSYAANNSKNKEKDDRRGLYADEKY